MGGGWLGPWVRNEPDRDRPHPPKAEQQSVFAVPAALAKLNVFNHSEEPARLLVVTAWQANHLRTVP